MRKEKDEDRIRKNTGKEKQERDGEQNKIKESQDKTEEQQHKIKWQMIKMVTTAVKTRTYTKPRRKG